MSNRSKTLLLLLGDLAILIGCMLAVVRVRLGVTYIPHHIGLFSFVFPLWILVYFVEGLYSLRTLIPSEIPLSLLRGTFAAIIIAGLLTYLLATTATNISPKTNLVLIGITALPVLYLWRQFFLYVFSTKGRLRQTCLIGDASTVELVASEVKNKPFLGYAIRPTLDDKTELVAIERNASSQAETYQKVFDLLGTGIEVIDLAKFAEKTTGKIPIAAIDQSWFIEHCGHQDSRSYEITKNLIDKIVALCLLLLLLPLALLVVPLVLIAQGKPLFFTQRRVGLHNRPFTILKLRTMVNDAEKDGAQWARPGDSRVTPMGKFLRKTRIDELPQLINILRGDMSLVGPRPERPEMIEGVLAKEIPFYNLRHLVRPGVTGWAQVSFRYGFSKQDSMEKLQFDLYYVKNRSIWLDVIVILKTIKTVLTGAGH